MSTTFNLIDVLSMYQGIELSTPTKMHALIHHLVLWHQIYLKSNNPCNSGPLSGLLHKAVAEMGVGIFSQATSDWTRVQASSFAKEGSGWTQRRISSEKGLPGTGRSAQGSGWATVPGSIQDVTGYVTQFSWGGGVQSMAGPNDLGDFFQF